MKYDVCADFWRLASRPQSRTGARTIWRGGRVALYRVHGPPHISSSGMSGGLGTDTAAAALSYMQTQLGWKRQINKNIFYLRRQQHTGQKLRFDDESQESSYSKLQLVWLAVAATYKLRNCVACLLVWYRDNYNLLRGSVEYINVGDFPTVPLVQRYHVLLCKVSSFYRIIFPKWYSWQVCHFRLEDEYCIEYIVNFLILSIIKLRFSYAFAKTWAFYNFYQPIILKHISVLRWLRRC